MSTRRAPRARARLAPPPAQGADTADRILHLLKSRGAQSAQALAASLGISAMGARQQLLRLEQRGLVGPFSRAEKVGRPARLWELAPDAWARFPDRHEELTVQLIASVREIFGEQGLEQLVTAREQDSERRYRAALAGCRNLGERVRRLAALRSAEGYMASAVRERGGWLLIEDHCPVCAAARACQGFCRAELELFRRCLGAEVERTEYLLDGARRCAYRIGVGPARGSRAS